MLELRAEESMPSGPPYAPQNALFGGIPSVSTDIPICAVFLALYLSFAATSSTLFQLNRRRGHKFYIILLFTGFCMARVLTCILRISWATRLTNVSLSIAAMLLANVGVFALFVINLILAQRILCAKNPRLGWNSILKAGLAVLYVVIAIAFVVVIVFTVLSFYTLDTTLLRVGHDVNLAVATFLLVVTVLPYVILASAYLPSRLSSEAEASSSQHFGQGSVTTKTIMVLALTTLMVLEEGYKVGIAWIPTVHSKNDPPWYDSKTCFYVFGFTLEIIYLAIAIGGRIDRRFWIPDGSSKRRSYAVFEPGRVGKVDVEESSL